MTAYHCALQSLAADRITVCIPGRHHGRPVVSTCSWPSVPQADTALYSTNPYVRVCFHIGVAEVARADAVREGMELPT